MDISEIRHTILKDYWKDRTGKTIFSGDLLLHWQNDSVVKSSSDEVMIDYSFIDFSCKRYRDSIINRNISPNFPSMKLAEYFDVEGTYWLFCHAYRNISFRFFPEFSSYVKWMSKMQANDLDKIFIKYGRYDDEKLMEMIEKPCIDKKAIIRDSDHIIIPFSSTVDGQFFKKIARGMKQRKSWVDRNDKLPKIFLELNNDGENEYSLSNFENERLNLYKLYGKEERSMKIYCKHPAKEHSEIIYQFSSLSSKI